MKPVSLAASGTLCVCGSSKWQTSSCPLKNAPMARFLMGEADVDAELGAAKASAQRKSSVHSMPGFARLIATARH